MRVLILKGRPDGGGRSHLLERTTVTYLQNVVVRLNNPSPRFYAPAGSHPIHIELDGFVKLDIEIRWAIILASFLTSPPYALDVSFESRDRQRYNASWKIGLVGPVAVIKVPMGVSVRSYAISEQLAAGVVAKLNQAIDEVRLSEIAPLDARPADSLAAAKLRMDNNLRDMFG